MQISQRNLNGHGEMIPFTEFELTETEHFFDCKILNIFLVMSHDERVGRFVIQTS